VANVVREGSRHDMLTKPVEDIRSGYCWLYMYNVNHTPWLR